MSGPFAAYINRTLKVARDATNKVVRMEGLYQSGVPKVLFTYRSSEDIKQHVVGCDADIGGRSTTRLDLSPDDGKGRFWGNMSLEVPRGKETTMRSGYAGFRNRVRTTLFGNITDDLTLHNYLALRVRPAGDPRTRTAYFVNVQTDGPIPTDLWQHRLYLPENSGNTWESVVIPLESFVLTNAGETASEQLSMMRSRIRSVGISILGGNAKVAGLYELGIDYIGAIEYMQDAEALDRLVNKPEETKASPH